MLTKNDLEKISDLLKGETNPIKVNVTELSSGVAELSSGVNELSSGVAELSSGVAELKSGVVELRKEFKKQGKDIKYLRKTLDLAIDHFDNRDIKLRKEIDQIKQHVGMTE
ncbi:MAG TPA: hypothetical protein VLG67_00935 [Candidatus Saccharimonadales bacterium]|nr:hypothetical protein [Candidatus Saccharimonadales bacterium]